MAKRRKVEKVMMKMSHYFRLFLKSLSLCLEILRERQKVGDGLFRFGIIRDTPAVGGARTQYISPAASFLSFGMMENQAHPCYILVDD